MQNKQRLIVDMDGVLADVYSQFLKMDEAETGVRQPIEKILGLPEYEAFKHGRKHVNSPGFFINVPLMEGSVAVIEKLNTAYELFIVSAAMEFPNSLTEKLTWLTNHFPFLTWHQFVFCGSKTVIQGDIMIDDHFKNLDYFKGRTLLFTQPHNYGQDEKGHERVHTWHDIEKLLLP
jgi:5'(3')-deoxyribonucleotidase